MLKKDKAILENLVRKYGRKHVLDEAYLGPKGDPSRTDKRPLDSVHNRGPISNLGNSTKFKYLQRKKNGFKIDAWKYDKRWRELSLEYVANLDELYYTDELGRMRIASVNGTNPIKSVDMKKVEEVMRWFKYYKPDSKWNNIRYFTYED